MTTTRRTPKRATTLTRWLRSLSVCPTAIRAFRHARSFDKAWAKLDTELWVWWLGYTLLGLRYGWDYVYHKPSKIDQIDRMKRRIHDPVKALYLTFKAGKRQKSRHAKAGGSS